MKSRLRWNICHRAGHMFPEFRHSSYNTRWSRAGMTISTSYQSLVSLVTGNYLWIYKYQRERREFGERWERAMWRHRNERPAITSLLISLADDVHYGRWFVGRLLRARQRDERNRRRPVVPRIGRRVHKSSGIPRALIIPLVHSYACTPPSIPHRETQITAASVINSSAICLGRF